MRTSLSNSILVGVVFGSFISCSKINPKEQIPTYITINKFSVSTDYATQGTQSNNFTDAWIYVDDQPLGAYELPATIPILQNGKHQIKARGGIKVNGISANRSQYAMIGFYEQWVDLQLDKVTILTPNVTYFTSLNFSWLEDFEGQGVSLVKTGNSDTSVVITKDSADVFEGKKSAKIYLDNTNSFFEATSSSLLSLPKGKDVFLELNYKCNNIFQVGIYSSSSSTSSTTLYLNSTNNQWNKIYINLINEVTAANANSYLIFISMQKDPNMATANLSLDNIKLIY